MKDSVYREISEEIFTTYIKQTERKLREISEEIFTTYLKQIERKLSESLKDVPDEVMLCALGNVLVRKCLELGVDECNFFAQMYDAWDYHNQE